ncbi:hypothetical protein [Nocardia sp. NPDC052566]|uniref:hypothetical protein n=1 Tax=Nocardia sp. NPDC052566 TaxID=3364330 RepID=UPI0037C672F1
MNSRRPVNRVTSKRKPAAEQSAQPQRRTVARPAGKRDARPVKTAGSRTAEKPQRPERVAPGLQWFARPVPRIVARPKPTPVSGPSWTVVAVVAVFAVLLGTFAVFGALRPGVDDSNKAFVDNKATEEVKAAAENALKTIYSTDSANVAGYKAALPNVLTGAMLTEFDKYADTTFSSLGQAQVRADAKPGPSGVTLLTSDRAELIVNLVVSASKGGVAQQSAFGPVIVRMQKVGGKWLASEIPDRPVLQAPPQ